MKKLSTFWELEKCNEAVDYYPTISAQETKQTNKVTSLTLTFSFEKRSCLIRSKKKKVKPKTNKQKNSLINKKRQ